VAPDVWVIFYPAAAYAHLAAAPVNGGRWQALRRPMLVAVVFGCAISLMTSGRLTLRLAGPATIYWSFVPLLEVASLAAVSRNLISPRVIDLFFMGHAPWSLWLVGFAAIWALVPPIRVFAWMADKSIWYGSAIAVMAWSGYIDFWFYRRVLKRPPARALRDLLLQRLIAWPLALFCFLASAGWQVVATRLGL
jgi:hypothetical protein